ncbi:hypothetical protein [Thermophilibacter provencensis]|uniref:helix-turn-helix domain-containing protein n=1 Tax=Thermophilibacter provencensis TaxID=1852386 RepID=UPI0029425989|nr:hypothetical protein [Thermophilibacter provencensis]
MSEFAAYLRELLDEFGQPIASVARGSGVERTSIHKALKDERMLSYQAVRSLADYLQLDLARSRELTRRYEILLKGEGSYAEQAAIQEMLLDLSRLSIPVTAPAATVIDTASAAEPSEGLVTGSLAVAAALRALVAASAGSAAERDLLLYLPPEADLADALAGLWRRPGAPRVRQLVSLAPERSGTSARVSNLQAVRRLLQVSLTSGGRFFSYCFYGEGEAASVDPLPFFVVAGSWVARLDESLTLAHVTCDPGLVRLYRERFGRVLGECRPLNSYSADPLDVLGAYMSATDDEGYYTLMTMPCLGRYYTRELIERQVRPGIPGRELIVEAADARFARLRGLSGSYYTVFTEEGLRRFAADGVIVDLPAELVMPLAPLDRARLLRSLAADLSEGAVCALIADPAALAVPPFLTLTADPRFGLHVYAIEGYAGGTYACNLHIDESCMGRALMQFIQSLPRGRLVRPAEQTLEILDELASGLEAGIEGVGTHGR